MKPKGSTKCKKCGGVVFSDSQYTTCKKCTHAAKSKEWRLCYSITGKLTTKGEGD